MNKNILVTGGAGFIGSYACKALSMHGYTPIVFDNLVYGHDWAVKWGPFEKGDLLDKSQIDRVIQKYHPQAVMHFAAYAYVGESVEKPGKYYRNNVVGSLNLLESMRDHKVNKFIFSSTCAIFGEPKTLPISEHQPPQPINAYGNSKFMVERILRDFDAAYGMRSISLRYFNAAGADPDAEIGEVHDPETHLIPLILDVALGRRPYVSVFGEDYETPDGTCVRDYIHIADLAEAHVAALKQLELGGPTNAFNLGNGKGFSVREVIEAAGKVTGKEIAYLSAPRRPGDPPVLVADSRFAMEALGWKPKFPNLEVILAHGWNWHQKYFAKA